MCLLLETIQSIDGKLLNLEFHQIRFENAQRKIFGLKTHLNLSDEIQIPYYAQSGIFRCRVIYGEQIGKIEFLPFLRRKIKSIRLIEDNEIDYTFKFENREKLNQLFAMRGTCDDIIIIKNGYVTDSFAGNLVFFDGVTWWTSDTPLLAGTQRARLLAEDKIKERPITTTDIYKYKKAGLINAMNDLESMPVIDICDIFQ